MPAEVEAFLKNFLPSWIASHLDFSTLKKEPDSFINENLRQYFSDIIYSCQWKDREGSLKLSFLLEHKSYIPKNIFIQLLRYLTEAYDHQYKSNELLTLVLPIVVYHGEGKWKKRSFVSFFEMPDQRFEKYIPHFDFELIDLKDISDDLIIHQSASLYLRSAFLVFKHKNDKEFIEQFSQEIFIFVEEEMDEARKLFFLRSLLTYIFQAFRYEGKEFQDFTKKLPKMIEPIAGSLWNTLIQEGMEKGMEKGMEVGIEKERMISHLEEKINLLVKLIIKNFNEETIADISGLSLAFVREFRKNSADKKVEGLRSSITTARTLRTPQAVEQYLVKQLKQFGFSLSVLSSYFGKTEKVLEQILDQR